jgi:hydroxymethylpyrimidine/phosphomethylpyrimidine kinase
MLRPLRDSSKATGVILKLEGLMVAAMRTALTIAGSDSGGGAGIQADLKSFAAIGVHGTSVITCVTAQNTKAVTSIFPLPTSEIRAQLRAVLADFDVRGAKTGMLFSADIVKAVASEMRGKEFPLVVDPVMIATVGARLEQDDFRDALVDRLIPRAAILTPNRHEAERIAGFPIRGIEDMEAAARAIWKLGAGAVLVKGGHVAGELIDVYCDGRTVRHFRSFRHPKELHGAGCTLAASIAGYLAQGQALLTAVESGRRRVAAGFLTSYRAGRGVEIINSQVQPDRYGVWLALAQAGPRLSRVLPPALKPESGLELLFALPGAATRQDVAVWKESHGTASFGASGRAARESLAVLRVNPILRASTTLKYRGENAERLQSFGFDVATLDRQSSGPGGAVSGGMERAIAEAGSAPDIVVDAAGGGGPWAMRVLGQDPDRVLRMVRRIVRSGLR